MYTQSKVKNDKEVNVIRVSIYDMKTEFEWKKIQLKWYENMKINQVTVLVQSLTNTIYHVKNRQWWMNCKNRGIGSLSKVQWEIGGEGLWDTM